jgi:D-alanine-D-alanine ligase
MRVLVLRSDVAENAPPDEQDTLVTANAVAAALINRGHETMCHAFVPDYTELTHALRTSRAEVVFNLVESVFGQGDLAGVAAAILARRGIPFTGASAAALSCAADKCFTKKLFRAAGLPTADWSEPPYWNNICDDRLYVVKSINEDASIGLDDGAVVGGNAVSARAAASAAAQGGRWFAEAYCPGREFNISVLAENGAPRVLPIAETRFESWQPDRPRIVGYAAKWHGDSPDCIGTPRSFGLECEWPALADALCRLARSAWHLLNIEGYARVDVRLDSANAPMILEINPNPCL